MYAWYYQQKAGIKRPWNSKDCYTIASGDDVVIFVRPDLANKVKSTIEQYTTRNIKQQFVGLGQCVKEVHLGAFYEIEFCSKWSFTLDGTINTWHMCRDVSKLLKTR